MKHVVTRRLGLSDILTSTYCRAISCNSRVVFTLPQGSDIAPHPTFLTSPTCRSPSVFHSRAALTPPLGSAIALNPIYPAAFTSTTLGYCLVV